MLDVIAQELIRMTWPKRKGWSQRNCWRKVVWTMDAIPSMILGLRMKTGQFLSWTIPPWVTQTSITHPDRVSRFKGRLNQTSQLGSLTRRKQYPQDDSQLQPTLHCLLPREILEMLRVKITRETTGIMIVMKEIRTLTIITSVFTSFQKRKQPQIRRTYFLQCWTICSRNRKDQQVLHSIERLQLSSNRILAHLTRCLKLSHHQRVKLAEWCLLNGVMTLLVFTALKLVSITLPDSILCPNKSCLVQANLPYSPQSLQAHLLARTIWKSSNMTIETTSSIANL